MENTLHILNGDSAMGPFKASGINGDHLVWKEVLSQGPINHPFNSVEFWMERSAYMTKAFDLKEGEYTDAVIAPFEKTINDIGQYSEICLWFEYDLFCQINMIALISFMGTTKPSTTQLTLVCAGEIEGEDKLYGLGELSPDQFNILFDSRLKLGSREIEYARDVFQTYCQKDAELLYNYVLMPFNEFKYLGSSLETHLRRFPYSDSGLTEIEQKIIELINSGVKSDRQIVGELLRWQVYYGFGDLQYFGILYSMKPLFDDFSKLKLKENVSFQDVEKLLDRDIQLGGAFLKDWMYDVNEKTLVSRDQRSIL